MCLNYQVGDWWMFQPLSQNNQLDKTTYPFAGDFAGDSVLFQLATMANTLEGDRSFVLLEETLVFF